MRILLVEDDPMIGESMVEGLKRQGYAIDWVQDGISANVALETTPFALVILDLALPQMDGLQVLAKARQKQNDTPILITSARDTLEDKIKGLDAGADDYLIKPFDFEELFARVRAIIRRSEGRSQPTIVRGDLIINPATHMVTYKGEAILFSAREFAILMALAQRPGLVLSRAQLEEALYNWDATIESNTIEVHIHHLRKKLGEDSIKTIRGVGYILQY